VAWLLRPTEALPPAVDEVRLRAEAAADPRAVLVPDAGSLRRVVEEDGIDRATALLDAALRCAHAPFVKGIDALPVDPSRLPRLLGTQLVVPAAFYRELPGLGGDGRLVASVAASFGLATELLPSASTGGVTSNAELLARRLLASPARSVVLTTLSRGGAEARLALERHPEAARAVAVWIQVCGLVRGTPLADQLLDASVPRRLAARAFLSAVGVSWATLAELSRDRGPLSGEPRVPAGFPIVNVVGLPLLAHLGGRALARHRALAPLGPNDGSTLVTDAIVPGGHVYPVWGADHFLRVPAASALLYRLFLWLARQGILESS